MTIKVKIAVQSHLSDSLIEVEANPGMAMRRIIFVKFLLAKYPDLNAEVEEDELNQIANDLESKYNAN